MMGWNALLDGPELLQSRSASLTHCGGFSLYSVIERMTGDFDG
jgi:hypothetical protein